MPHLLILGGTGFLGRLIADRALADGFRVSVVGRRKPHRPEIHQVSFDSANGRWLGAAPAADVVVNALACYGNSGLPIDEMFRVNRDLPFAFIRQALEGAKPPALVVNIDSALRSEISAYAESKAELRVKLEGLAENGAPIVGLRLEQFYGPGDGSGKFLTMLITKFLTKAPAIQLSSGTQERRFLYATDAVDVIADTLRRGLARELKFSKDSAALLPNLGEKITVRDFVRKVQKFSNGEATHLDFGAIPDRGIETDERHMIPAYDFLEQHQTLSLDQGIPRVVEFERARLAR